MKYLKDFSTHNDYVDYISGGGSIPKRILL